VKARLVLSVVAVAAALALAGCGGDGGSDSNDPASLAPPTSPLFIQATVRPRGELKANVESLVSDVAGIDDIGQTIVDELESSASDSGEDFDFARDIEPWLGERAGMFFERFDGEDFHGYGVALPTTDAEATQAFIDKQSAASDDPVGRGSYEGVDYTVDESDQTTVGIVGHFLLIAEDEQAFESAVDASEGDSLSGQSQYDRAISAVSNASIADVYVDIGGLLDQAGTAESDQAVQVFKSIGLDPADATAVASVVPKAGQVEIDISSDLGDAEAPSGDVSELIGSLPSSAFAAFGASGFSEQLKEAIDELDGSGIPGELPPNQLKSTLKAMGIDLDRIADSLEDAAVFAQGSGEGNLGGALVFTTSSGEAAETVANIGVLLRNTGVPGVTAVTGKASGFSIRDPGLGRQPLVIVARDDRIAIGYGLAPALRGVAAGGGATLSDTPSYETAVSALGDTPLSAFVDGPGVMRLIDGLGAGSDPDFRSALPYLRKADFLAAGTGSEDGLTTAKLIVGFK
jgi:Protein of unknown function (DUF3352)